MPKQGRQKGGKFASKSDEPRHVRAVRLTDSAWKKIGAMALARGMTRADLLEEWARQPPVPEVNQLEIFAPTPNELITPETRKNGSELARRLNVTSGAITNWLGSGDVTRKTKEHDPDNIAWERVVGTRYYRPIF